MTPATIYYRCSVIILPPRGHAPVRAIDMYRDGLRDTFLLRHVHTVLLLPASVCRLFQMDRRPFLDGAGEGDGCIPGLMAIGWMFAYVFGSDHLRCFPKLMLIELVHMDSHPIPI